MQGFTGLTTRCTAYDRQQSLSGGDGDVMDWCSQMADMSFHVTVQCIRYYLWLSQCFELVGVRSHRVIISQLLFLPDIMGTQISILASLNPLITVHILKWLISLGNIVLMVLTVFFSLVNEPHPVKNVFNDRFKIIQRVGVRYGGIYIQ